MSFEIFLHFLHLFAHSLFGITLHAGVEGGINFQTIGIGVEFRRHIPQFVKDSLPEIERCSVVSILDREAEFDGQVLQTVTLAPCKMPMCVHVFDDGVAASQGILGVDFRIVGRCGLKQSYKHGGLFHCKVLRRGAEVSLCGSLYAVGVRTEVDRVGVHRKDFLLGADHFEFRSDDHLLAFHDNHLHSRDISKQTRVFGAHLVDVLHQLLGDGRCPSCVSACRILEGCKEPDEVDAAMLVETFVFGGDECIDEVLRYLLVLDRRAVFVEEFVQEYAIVAVHLRCDVGLGMDDFAHRRAVAEEPEEIHLYGYGIQQTEDNETDETGDGLPPPGLALELTFVPLPCAFKFTLYAQKELFHTCSISI